MSFTRAWVSHDALTETAKCTSKWNQFRKSVSSKTIEKSYWKSTPPCSNISPKGTYVLSLWIQLLRCAPAAVGVESISIFISICLCVFASRYPSLAISFSLSLPLSLSLYIYIYIYTFSLNIYIYIYTFYIYIYIHMYIYIYIWDYV